MSKQNGQLPIIEERDGQLFFSFKETRLVLNKTSLMRSMNNCKEVSASTAQRLLASFNLEMSLTTPREIYAPIVMSYVQVAWHAHFYGVVDAKILERHDRRVDRYRRYLISGAMPEILAGIKGGVRKEAREKLYTLKPGTAQRGGQLGLVIAALSKLGPSNISQITAEIVRLGLKTCQPAERITRYYVVTRLNKEIIDATTDKIGEGEGPEKV